LCRFGEIRPNIHNPQFCQGQSNIAFPWYEGEARSIHIDFEFSGPGERPDSMVININNQPFEKKISKTDKLQTVIVDGSWSDNEFLLSVSTNPAVRFRILKIMPC
jgi:hypothetical protein